MEWVKEESLWTKIKNIIDEIADEMSYLRVYSKSAFVRISYEGKIILLDIDFGVNSNYWDLLPKTEDKIQEIIDKVCARCSVRIGNSYGQSLIGNKGESKIDHPPFVSLTIRNDYAELGYGYSEGSMSEEVFESINNIAFTLGKDLGGSGKRVKVRLSPTVLD